jgi:hypothetical protein
LQRTTYNLSTSTTHPSSATSSTSRGSSMVAVLTTDHCHSSSVNSGIVNQTCQFLLHHWIQHMMCWWKTTQQEELVKVKEVVGWITWCGRDTSQYGLTHEQDHMQQHDMLTTSTTSIRPVLVPLLSKPVTSVSAKPPQFLQKKTSSAVSVSVEPQFLQNLNKNRGFAETEVVSTTPFITALVPPLLCCCTATKLMNDHVLLVWPAVVWSSLIIHVVVVLLVVVVLATPTSRSTSTTTSSS